MTDDQALQVERLCTHFEAAWQCGEQPRSESYRSQVPETVWPELLRELLALEMDYRLLDAGRRLVEIETLVALSPPALPNGLPMGKVAVAFDGYDKVEEAGRGAEAIVYRAWHSALQRWEALKFIAGTTSPRERERFRFGAEAAASLDHPNIVPVYGFDEGGGRPFFAMKWVEGRTLAAVLRDPGHDLRDGADAGDGGAGGAARPPARHLASRSQAGQHPPRRSE